MGLLQTIKSLLGLDGTRSAASGGTSGEQDVDVTVEHEPSTDSEDAVKGTETASRPPETDELEADDERAGDDEHGAPSADGTDSAPAEAADAASDADTESVSTASSAVDAAQESADEPDADADAEADAADEPALAFEGADDPVTEIKGIGPAYADRLAGLDIETVGDLAVADAADVAAQTDLAETRVAGWIERANDY
ncbi:MULTISPECIES: helix-hairpin-helix domain-containing protein [Haloarcula]|uniref:helix-hairpin-helix domain-containing protein n=1 Tax=Haloarcula TaxID=2237 RepID=UPI0023ECD88B|nr:helix-hairpin-helix domain-containing protein [Halomicroarcula sp. XH51]